MLSDDTKKALNQIGGKRKGGPEEDSEAKRQKQQSVLEELFALDPYLLLRFLESAGPEFTSQMSQLNSSKIDNIFRRSLYSEYFRQLVLNWDAEGTSNLIEDLNVIEYMQINPNDDYEWGDEREDTEGAEGEDDEAFDVSVHSYRTYKLLERHKLLTKQLLAILEPREIHLTRVRKGQQSTLHAHLLPTFIFGTDFAFDVKTVFTERARVPGSPYVHRPFELQCKRSAWLYLYQGTFSRFSTTTFFPTSWDQTKQHPHVYQIEVPSDPSFSLRLELLRDPELLRDDQFPNLARELLLHLAIVYNIQATEDDYKRFERETDVNLYGNNAIWNLFGHRIFDMGPFGERLKVEFWRGFTALAATTQALVRIHAPYMLEEFVE